MKGLSLRNLRYMRDFALAYPQFSILQAPLAKLEGDRILQAPLAKLSWYHHITLLDKVKDPGTRLFYILKTVQNGWSRNVMVHQIESELHKRQGKAITNFESILPKQQSDLARETLRNPYLFDFLGMGEDIEEKDLENALINHIKKFTLELGRGFAYVGNQYNLVVDGDDYFLDLLFYNYHLHCFVLFELKVGAFKPEYAGKLNFYINTVDGQVKGADDKPTIGVLLCKTPNKTVVKYSLKGMNTPVGVAEYKLLPKNVKSEMPTIREFERELNKEAKKFHKPVSPKLKKE